jgi:exodeoxyribonuclease-3
MHIASYNVNGLRAALKKDFLAWMKEADFDVLHIQEVKAQQGDIDWSVFTELGYYSYLDAAEKKGYSGVLTLTKQKPDNVVNGMANEKYDREGRVLRTDFGNITLLNCYFPSGTSGEERQGFKYEFLADFEKFVNKLKVERPNIVLSGDLNIAHAEIDIHDPKGNKNSSGFLPEERAWMTQFLHSGWKDTFRLLNADAKDQYSWWTLRAGARDRNKVWRIDYNLATAPLAKNIKAATILQQVRHSDHCPVVLDLEA